MTHTIEQYIAECGEHVLQAFSALPRPSKKLEDWKFFANQDWFEKQWNTHAIITIAEQDIVTALQGISYDSLLVFANGEFREHMSHIQSFVKISTTAYKPLFESKNLTQLDVIHTIAPQNGLTIRIQKTEQISHIVLLSFVSGNNALTSASHTIHVEDHVTVRITEILVSVPDCTNLLMLTGTQIICNAQSNCEFTSIQNVHESVSVLQSLAVTQLQHTTCTIHTYPLRGSYIRSNISVYKQGIQAHTNMYGILFPCANEHVEAYTKIYHNVPECETNEQIKGIANDNGQGVFSGLIYVAQDAQKTRAVQSNKNMLLSPTAKIHSKPQLEIYADDVSCNHGSTTGQINKEALWYMQSRGINPHDATRLLLDGFILEVIKTISAEDIQQYVLHELGEKGIRV